MLRVYFESSPFPLFLSLPRDSGLSIMCTEYLNCNAAAGYWQLIHDIINGAFTVEVGIAFLVIILSN